MSKMKNEGKYDPVKAADTLIRVALVEMINYFEPTTAGLTAACETLMFYAVFFIEGRLGTKATKKMLRRELRRLEGEA